LNARRCRRSGSETQRELVSVADAARRLGISRHTLRAWLRLRRLPFVRLGRRVLLEPEALDRYVRARVVAAESED
jgi:excisionase family DNA binding protein